MGQPVSGIRDSFFRDLTADYQSQRERSFLYRYFWAENARDLLEKHFPRLLPEAPQGPEDGARIRARLRAALAERPERVRDLLLRDPPGDDRRERRDFWQELMLNDAGYQAGLVADTDYYRWLVGYLTVRDIYYKDSSLPGGHTWLYPLLLAGLRGTEAALTPGQLRRNGEDIRTKSQVARDLAELARQIREERAAGRLHGLTVSERGRDGAVRRMDYLPWLTGRLEWMALHIKIRTWLQDSGHPIKIRGGEDTPAEKGRPPKPRKQDFSLRLFEAYCDSPEGRRLRPGGLSGWRVTGEGFCVLDAGPQQIQALLDALERHGDQEDRPGLYLPLAVHLYSGCVFFLAGKGLYESLYSDAPPAVRAAYERAAARFCFDFLRVDPSFWMVSRNTAGVPFRLRPTFHENAGRSYDRVLSDFKLYCTVGPRSPLQVVRGANPEVPAGTPDLFRWAFDGLKD